MKTKCIIVTSALMMMNIFINAAASNLYDINTLRTIKLRFSQADWWDQLEANVEADENILATLVFEDQTFDSVGVRFRGMTSYKETKNSKKKSFNIELDWIKNQELMGYEELNLINCFQDPTFMREVLYSNTCREVLPSARVNFVKLIINDENWGIYASVQQLDGTFIREWFPSNEGTRWRAGTGQVRPGGRPGGGGGGFNPGSALQYKGADSTEYAKIYEIKNTNQENPWEALILTCDVLNHTPGEQLPIELPKVLNVDRALWLCAFEIVFHDDDGYMFKRGSDYYLYYEPESGRIHFIQYDANSCMVIRRGDQWSPFYREYDPDVPVMSLLMPIQEYRQRYLAHVRAIVNNYLTEDYLVPKIDAYRALIETEVKQDDKKLYSNWEFDNGITILKSFITQRRNFLLNNQEVKRQAPTILSVQRRATDQDIGQQLTITASIDTNLAIKEVNLFLAEGDYAPFTSLAMTDDGENGDATANDNVYCIQLPTYIPGTLLRYYVQVIADDEVGTMTFEPFAEHKASRYVVTYSKADVTPVIINELMAQNNSTYADPQGEYDDWIELKNISSEVIDLSGMYLSDKLDNPLKWQFPDSVFIEPGAYLIVWADEDGNDEPGLHANFKLSSQGEIVLLFDKDANGNVLLDSLSFGTLNADVSFGRYPDASDNIELLSVPTPLAANLLTDTAVTETNLPSDFILEPNYPNPFNPSTTINFSIPQTAHIRITIYNVLGMEIKNLINETRSPGHYSVVWDGSGENSVVTSGIYLCRFEANASDKNFIQVHRMVLLK